MSDKTQEASHFVAKLIAKTMKSHTIAEALIFLACSAIIKTIFGSEAEQDVNKVTFSHNAITDRFMICPLTWRQYLYFSKKKKKKWNIGNSSRKEKWH